VDGTNLPWDGTRFQFYPAIPTLSLLTWFTFGRTRACLPTVFRLTPHCTYHTTTAPGSSSSRLWATDQFRWTLVVVGADQFHTLYARCRFPATRRPPHRCRADTPAVHHAHPAYPTGCHRTQHYAHPPPPRWQRTVVATTTTCSAMPPHHCLVACHHLLAPPRPTRTYTFSPLLLTTILPRTRIVPRAH